MQQARVMQNLHGFMPICPKTKNCSFFYFLSDICARLRHADDTKITDRLEKIRLSP